MRASFCERGQRPDTNPAREIEHIVGAEICVGCVVGVEHHPADVAPRVVRSTATTVRPCHRRLLIVPARLLAKLRVAECVLGLGDLGLEVEFLLELAVADLQGLHLHLGVLVRHLTRSVSSCESCAA